MAFTQRHFQAVADVINDAMNNVDQPMGKDVIYFAGKVAGIEEVANDFARMFERDNPRFRRDLFMKACGLE